MSKLQTDQMRQTYICKINIATNNQMLIKTNVSDAANKYRYFISTRDVSNTGKIYKTNNSINLTALSKVYVS